MFEKKKDPYEKIRNDPFLKSRYEFLESEVTRLDEENKMLAGEKRCPIDNSVMKIIKTIQECPRCHGEWTSGRLE